LVFGADLWTFWRDYGGNERQGLNFQPLNACFRVVILNGCQPDIVCAYFFLFGTAVCSFAADCRLKFATRL
jgi:hypothetical protein